MDNNINNGGSIIGSVTSATLLVISMASFETWLRILALVCSIAASIYTIRKKK